MGFGVLQPKSLQDVPGTVRLEDLDPQHSLLTTTTAAAAIRRTTANLKYAKDGKTILVPQPSDDPNDPLNFPLWRRDMITCILCLLSVIASTLSPLLAANSLTLSFYFNRSFGEIALLTGYHLLGVGVAGFLFVASARVWGKRHLYIIGTVVILVSSAWGGASNSYGSLLAARFFQGVGLAPFEALVNDSVGDLYFVHERGVRMAFSNLSLFGGAFFTPVIVGVMTHNIGWRWTFYLLAIFSGVLLPFVILFVPETAYKRESPNPNHTNYISEALGGEAFSKETGDNSGNTSLDKQPDGVAIDTQNLALPRQKVLSKEALRLFNGRKSNESFWNLCFRPLPLFLHPGIFWAVLIQGCLIGWTVLIGIVLAVIMFGPPLFFNEVKTGYMYTGAFVGALLGFAIAGLIADSVPKWMAKRNGGVFEPEFRLVLVVPQLIFGCAGLYGFGFTAANAFKYHWFWPDFFFALEVMGMVLGAVASALYIVDAHPDIAVEGFTCLLVFKNIFSFALTFKGVDWLREGGVKHVFISIGSVQVGVCCLTIFMYVFGKYNRAFFAQHDILKILHPRWLIMPFRPATWKQLLSLLRSDA